MKSFRFFALFCLALVCAAAFVASPLAFNLLEPVLAPIALAVGVLGAATVLAIRHLLLTTASGDRVAVSRRASPAPQTGTPLVTAFA